MKDKPKPPFYSEHGERNNQQLSDWTRGVMEQIRVCAPGARLAEVPTLFAFGPIYDALASALEVQPERASVEPSSSSLLVGLADELTEALKKADLLMPPVSSAHATIYAVLAARETLRRVSESLTPQASSSRQERELEDMRRAFDALIGEIDAEGARKTLWMKQAWHRRLTWVRWLRTLKKQLEALAAVWQEDRDVA